MVFKKLLAGLGLGGVEVDTVLSPQPAVPGGQLHGQVNLRAKSDTDITAIWLLLVANTPFGEVELGRQQVAAGMRVAGGQTPSVPFALAVPAFVPFTALYGKGLPGGGVGVRTEVQVAPGSAKGDWDPARLDASPRTSRSSTRWAPSAAGSCATSCGPARAQGCPCQWRRRSRSTRRSRRGSSPARTSRS
ncbi:sporulation protein [Catellatospora bangladeshensis]|uniref:sporulation protein n=1 Tax=Catellatospora bangladeshensis TaxID=310355 RepID=UPI003610DB6E